MQSTKRFMSILLAVVMLAGAGFTGTVSAATDECKIVGVSTQNVFVENAANTLNVTVGSLYYSGGFTLAVYDGGTDRQKIYEGTGTVSDYDWGADTYGSAVVRIPLTARQRGIAVYDIYLTPEGGSAVKNTAVFRVFGGSEVASALLITDNAGNYTALRELLAQKGANVTVAAAPSGEMINNANLVIIGTSELQNLPADTFNALAGKSLLLYNNGGDAAAVNGLLAANGSALSLGGSLGEVRSQEYGVCVNYQIIDTDLERDGAIKNLFFHMADASVVTASGGDAETLVKADATTDVLAADLLPNKCKLALAGGDFLSDADLGLSSENMYSQAFANAAYDPADMRGTSNYSLTRNLLDWLLPVTSYREAEIKTVKTAEDMPGSFVSVTGTVVTPSESIDQNGMAFRNCIYIQDESGGIRVFGVSSDVQYTYKTWKVNIRGFVSSYNGEREIIVADQRHDIRLVSRKDWSVEPRNITVAQTGDNNLVGDLVRVTGKVTGTAAGSLTLKDESGEAAVFVDSYIGSSLGNWGRGECDPRIEYGCTVEVVGILSKQDGKNVIRIYDTANVLLKYDKDGVAVEPPAPKSHRRFGGGLVEVEQTDGMTVTLGEEKKELTEYMKLLTDMGIISVEALPGKDLPVGAAFGKLMEGCRLYTKQGFEYDNSVHGAALRVLAALGYDYFFINNGGDRATQEAIILNQSRILSGITADPKSALTSKDAARLIYNAFEIKFFGQKYYTASAETAMYQELGECILDKLYLTKTIGVITETRYTDVNAAIPRNTVKMTFTAKGKPGEDLFYSDIDGLTDLAGYRIEAYVKNDSDNDRNIVGVLKERRNTVWKLPSEDYNGFDNGKVKHIDVNGRERSLSINKDAKLYVNGVYGGAVSAANLTEPFNRMNTLAYTYGSYTFIDNNNDGAADTVCVEVYRDYVINSMDAQTYRIDDKISDVPLSIFLDPNYDNDFNVTYTKSDGSAATFADVAKGDVLSVATSRQDGKNVVWAKVVITKGSVSGKITSIDKGDMRLEVNGKWYDYVEIDNLRQDDFLFNLGDDGKFFVNKQGVVIMKDLKSMPYINYAFVIAYGVVDADFDHIPAMVVYLPTGSWTSYYFAKNVTVRDGGFSEALRRDEFANRYLRDNVTGDLTRNTRTLVNFELNDSGEIKTISFPFNNASGKNDKGRLTLDRKYNQPHGGNIPEVDDVFTYDQTLKCIGDAYMTDKTVIFDINLNGDETVDSVADIQDRINMIPVSKLLDGSAPVISLFDMGDGNECAAAVTVNALKSGPAPENMFILTAITESLIDGDVYYKFYGWENGEQKELVLDYECEITDFISDKPEYPGGGDLMLYNTNGLGRVIDIRVVMNVGLAKNYLPDVYGDGSLQLPKVNFYSDTSNPKQVVRYYYGLVTEKYTTKPYGKIVLAKDNTAYPTTLLDKLNFASMIATSEKTAFYRVVQWNHENPVRSSSLADAIPAVSGNFTTRNGDLAVVKTVNGVATDVIFISPSNY